MVNRHNFSKLNLSLIGTFTTILLVFAISSSQSLANTKENCNTKTLTNETSPCETKFEVIAGLNKDFQEVYGFGSVSSISQPPLVIMPEIAFAAPTVSDESLDTKESTKKIIRPISAQRKRPSSDLNLINIVNVLDKKGSRHLSICLKRLSSKWIGPLSDSVLIDFFLTTNPSFETKPKTVFVPPMSIPKE